ncbi:unnamed protein product [Linum tenue]|uniref:Folate-biopterin transporter 4 n=2 Tax=Linum tenue TaxID=586396 RepID=A0AAV0H487_9ROSI|nr:unnamed protein product [Linum tenue]
MPSKKCLTWALGAELARSHWRRGRVQCKKKTVAGNREGVSGWKKRGSAILRFDSRRPKNGGFRSLEEEQVEFSSLISSLSRPSEKMKAWAKQLKRSFGASFLWLVCLIYFTQVFALFFVLSHERCHFFCTLVACGNAPENSERKVGRGWGLLGFRSFVWTAVSYQLKDKLKLSPSASQFVSSVAFFPWSIKPLYGIVSDCISIRGRKRIPYLIIATILSLVPWPILGLNATFRNSSWHLMVLLTAQNLGTAMADVVVDAMIAEAVRSEKASFAGDLQSLSWFSMALGGICGSLLGGYALSNLPIDKIFLLFTVLPAIQLFSCVLVEETPVSSGDVPTSEDLGDSHDMNGNSPSDEDSYFMRKSSSTISKRKKSKKRGKKKRFSNKSQFVEKENAGRLGWYYSLKSATYSLLQAFRKPIILRPMAWFFLAHITFPNLSTVMFYYQTEFLNLDAAFLGTTRVIGWLGLMLGTFVYNRHLKTMKLRTILLYTHIGLSLLSLLDIVLVSRMNIAYGITDKHMVLVGSALADAINQFKFMPFLILSGQLCPPGIEGTLFALFMSINNFGSTVGSFVGAGLASFLNLSSGSFDNLLLGIAIQVACIYIPVLFLFLIPKEATGVSA